MSLSSSLQPNPALLLLGGSFLPFPSLYLQPRGLTDATSPLPLLSPHPPSLLHCHCHCLVLPYLFFFIVFIASLPSCPNPLPSQVSTTVTCILRRHLGQTQPSPPAPYTSRDHTLHHRPSSPSIALNNST
ncbi:hypothetical protein BU24DRAFT_428959 [Aaosphaeria arxii CBS 175.79]|uniref:Uncharacterized protein n=1 Tax=Aaosphaeria arxii CBS 175.79 TaxID=1450172 RepID=A0A6A5X7T7_9PLEO|nr:uncharacterized protein BU24DRAFT_428959 [Aaosphaeria arxii CBS 175.79]KAF2008990.1 hypothetical protein BU24DRAFT_428959 [Aaosphaeria arxii CBS 175.79]